MTTSRAGSGPRRYCIVLTFDTSRACEVGRREKCGFLNRFVKERLLSRCFTSAIYSFQKRSKAIQSARNLTNCVVFEKAASLILWDHPLRVGANNT